MFHSFAHWRDAQAWPGKYISAREFAERSLSWQQGGSPLAWDDDFIRLVDALRDRCRFPFTVTSGYRSPAHNLAVSHTGAQGPHTTGRAIDLHIQGVQALVLIRNALDLGFTGIGVSQKDASRFIHLDNLTSPAFPRPTIWSY